MNFPAKKSFYLIDPGSILVCKFVRELVCAI